MPRTARPSLPQPQLYRLAFDQQLEGQLAIVEDRAPALCQAFRTRELDEDDLDSMAQLCSELGAAVQTIELLVSRASRWRRWQTAIATGEAAR
jgi:hypothetical protein